MNDTVAVTLRAHFADFRRELLTAEELQGALGAIVGKMEGSATQRTLVEQTAARIDLILIGVCEAERDAHILALLAEVEGKLAPLP